MEISFETRLLRQICEDESTAKLELGEATAEKLKHRVADLRIASSTFELPVGNPRELKASQGHEIALDLNEDYCLIFCANHVSIPTLSTGKVDWGMVSRIKIIKIGSDNG